MINSKEKLKLGLFGGTFDPIHLGHINSASQILEKLELNKLIVMPANRSPSRLVEDSNVEARLRLEMVKRAFNNIKNIEVSDHEIERGGVSYTIDTISSVLKMYPQAELFLIIGLDQFLSFHTWKDYQEILKKVQLVVTSRPGYEFNFPDVPCLEGLISEVANKGNTIDEDDLEIQLKTGKVVHLLTLKDVDVSSSEIRQKMRAGETVNHLLSKEVMGFIEAEKLYPPVADILDNVEEFTKNCAKILDDNKALNIVAKDMRGEERPMEYVLITSGTSRRHATAIAEKLVRQVRKDYQLHPLSVEGSEEGQWIVVDYGPLMVHVFYDFTRQEYQLEQLWKDSKTLEL